MPLSASRPWTQHLLHVKQWWQPLHYKTCLNQLVSRLHSKTQHISGRVLSHGLVYSSCAHRFSKKKKSKLYNYVFIGLVYRKQLFSQSFHRLSLSTAHLRCHSAADTSNNMSFCHFGVWRSFFLSFLSDRNFGSSRSRTATFPSLEDKNADYSSWLFLKVHERDFLTNLTFTNAQPGYSNRNVCDLLLWLCFISSSALDGWV